MSVNSGLKLIQKLMEQKYPLIQGLLIVVKLKDRIIFKIPLIRHSGIFKPKIKKWNATEKKIVEENLALLPPWLSKYYIAETLRGDVGGSPKNPAASVSLTRTLLIFDQFFKEKDKRAVIIHEMSHS